VLAKHWSWLKRFAMGVLKRHPLVDSIRSTMRRRAYDEAFHVEILELTNDLKRAGRAIATFVCECTLLPTWCCHSLNSSYNITARPNPCSVATLESRYMSKQQAEENKSQAIRDVLTENIKMPVKQVQAIILERKGIKVSPNLVYLVRGKMLAKQRKQRREAAVASGKNSGAANAVALVKQVQVLAKEVGGYKNLRQLVEALEG
jgi:hypothetical protein